MGGKQGRGGREGDWKEMSEDGERGDEGRWGGKKNMQADGAATLKRDDVSEVGHRGKRTFMRRFAKATSLNPTEYIQQARVDQARGILELTTRPLGQVAWGVGYKDTSAFSQIFQRISGVSASEYRHQFGV